MSLQDSDNLIVGRGAESYKITYQDLKDDLNVAPTPIGAVATPTVLKPSAGAGGGGLAYARTDTISNSDLIGTPGGWNPFTNNPLSSNESVFDLSITGSIWHLVGKTSGIGGKGFVYYSTDQGQSWTKQTPTTRTSEFSSIDYDPVDNRWMIAGGNHTWLYSNNGTSWTAGNEGSGDLLNNVHHGTGGWIYSRDGGTKIHHSYSGTGSWSGSYSVVYGSYVTAIRYGEDDGNWVMTSVAPGDAGYYSVCTGGDPRTSDDWDIKSKRPTGCTGITALKRSNGLWVIGTSSGQIYRTADVTDDTSWEEITNPFSNNIRDFAYDPNTETWVCVGDNGIVGVSYDNCSTWKLAQSGSVANNASLRAVVYDNDRFIITGERQLVSFIPENYQSIVTVASDLDITEMQGEVFQTNGTGNPGPFVPTDYTLTTSSITAVDDTDPNNIVLSFSGANLDLKYFQEGDVLANGGEVVSVDTNANTMTVDGGTWSVSDVITLPVKAGVGSIIDVTGNVITIVPTEGRFIGPNSNGIDFSLAGPSKIDEPLLTDEVFLLSSDFALVPGSDADTLLSIVWEIDGTEHSAGTTNPWKPDGLLTPNTTHSVRVKHIGNILGASSYSPTVTFTTGATFASLFNRVAALESDEISDDATDSALLTLIANLTARIQALEESN